ncbi:MAG: SOS response-associated peptidase family protein [Oscillospiraceae bacterium]|nr:SOS response-associated peptidase family protein [Oscillospiraceae bacterium]
MCCRYYIEPRDSVLEEIGDAARSTALYERFLRALPQPLIVDGEVRPTDLAPVIASSKKGRKAYYPMQWGFNIENRSVLPNARTETAAMKPLFQNAWKGHRCVIPASWYYEWEHFLRPNGRKETGEKYLIQPKGEKITWLCGLYRMEKNLPHFVILTRAPSSDVSFIHDRMPLMIHEKDIDEWISPEGNPEEISYRAMTDLLYEKAQ